MKKRYSLSLHDISFIEVADILGTLWIVGLLLAYKSSIVSSFLVEWKWAFFALAIIIGIKPLWKMMYGERSAEGLPENKVVKKKTVAKKKKAAKKKK